MNANLINVLGYTGNNKQFVVKTLNTDLRVSENSKYPELEGPNPYEYLLAGFAGCINALGQSIAKEQGIVLRSLQIEITGDLTALSAEAKEAKPGFSSIEIKLKPATTVSREVLEKWMNEVQLRSPAYNMLVNNIPVSLVLNKDYLYN
ncbi:hypothetical protein GCM10007424_08420 [Flavobacterium suaedae]|uniref:OsmC family peroxiredoxin n=1 Tax=Flavobacterium suaedae TaxID=1767027 RepID=A0ABQ1JJR0_9FLAO|nr:OsmC family protein [Flavobacterium suaedae]GGB70758.1 hypothetical protein GCM10007424_08420 [Flavobacterium suaedae]